MKRRFAKMILGKGYKVGAVSLAFFLFSHAAHAFQAPQISDDQVARMTGKVRTELEAARERVKFPGASVGFVLPDGRSATVATGLADR